MKSRSFALLIGALVANALPARAFEEVGLSRQEPRAFGYSVGDVVTRTFTIDVPARFVLDAESLPKHGRRGKAIELRNIEWRQSSLAGGERHVLRLDYQVFVSPREVRTLELPPLTLRLAGQPRDENVRIDAWPLTVAPLVPIEVSPRDGLGDLRPDRPALVIDTSASRARLAAYAVVLTCLLGYLVFVYYGLPWWSRRHRPFSTAWSELRGLRANRSVAQWREAFQRVHQALNQTAGQVLFEAGIDRFIAKDPRFAALRGDLATFFRRSNEAFFSGSLEQHDSRWLIDFCRRCRDAERGAA